VVTRGDFIDAGQERDHVELVNQSFRSALSWASHSWSEMAFSMAWLRIEISLACAEYSFRIAQPISKPKGVVESCAIPRPFVPIEAAAGAEAEERELGYNRA